MRAAIGRHNTSWSRPAKAQAPRRNRHDVTDSLFEACPMGVSISRLRDGRFVQVNDAFTRNLGYRREETLGRTCPELRLWPDPALFDALVHQLQSAGSVQDFEARLRTRNGEVHDYTLFARRLAFHGEALCMLMYVDVTGKRAAEDEIARLAYYDALTGLPNRRLLMERVHHAQLGSTRTRHHGALMFIDLDNFKQVNDTEGHQAGDMLLYSVGQRLQMCVREQDTVARLGGDEFVVLLEELNESAALARSEAVQIMDKVMQQLNRPYLLGKTSQHCTPSLGLTLFFGKDEAAEELFRRADAAMYQSKANGKNSACLHEAPLAAPATSPPVG